MGLAEPLVPRHSLGRKSTTLPPSTLKNSLGAKSTTGTMYGTLTAKSARTTAFAA